MEKLILALIKVPASNIVEYLIDLFVDISRLNWERFLVWIDEHVKKVPSFFFIFFLDTDNSFITIGDLKFCILIVTM